MLCLSIRVGEGFYVGREDGTGPQVECAVFKIDGNKIKIGVTADCGTLGEQLPIRRGLRKIKVDASRIKSKFSCSQKSASG